MSKRNPMADVPTAPGFWVSLATEYNEAHKNDEPEPEHAHYGRPVSWLAHRGNCPDGSCLRRKIRWMAAQPEESHAGRNGRRLAVIHGVKL